MRKMSLYANPRRANHLSQSYQSHIPSFSLSIYEGLRVHVCLDERDYAGMCTLCVFAFCKRKDTGRSQIATAITHTNGESSTLLSPYSEIRLWIPLALQFDQSADLQPPLQHTDEA